MGRLHGRFVAMVRRLFRLCVCIAMGRASARSQKREGKRCSDSFLHHQLQQGIGVVRAGVSSGTGPRSLLLALIRRRIAPKLGIVGHQFDCPPLVGSRQCGVVYKLVPSLLSSFSRRRHGTTPTIANPRDGAPMVLSWRVWVCAGEAAFWAHHDFNAVGFSAYTGDIPIRMVGSAVASSCIIVQALVIHSVVERFMWIRLGRAVRLPRSLL